MGSIPTFFIYRYKGFCLHGPYALALWWLFPFVELTGGSPRVHIYIYILFSLETLSTSVPWPACIEWAEGWCAEGGHDSDVG